MRAHLLLDELAARLPEPWRDGELDLNPELIVAVSRTVMNDGDWEWEVEWCPCDPQRNCCKTGDSLYEVLLQVKAHDDAALVKKATSTPTNEKGSTE